MAMRQHAARQILLGCAMPLLLAQTACVAATPQGRLPAASPAAGPAASVSKAERKGCEAEARTEAAGTLTPSVAHGAGGGAAGALAAFHPQFVVQSMGASLVAAPVLAPIFAVVGGVGSAIEGKQLRDEAYRRSRDDCLERLSLEQTLGPNDPAVVEGHAAAARRYLRLADANAAVGARFAVAAGTAPAEPVSFRTTEDAPSRGFPSPAFESSRLAALASRAREYRLVARALYQSALAIQERTLGPDHPEVADSLEGYAVLLRALTRDAEATAQESRARTIRSINR